MELFYVMGDGGSYFDNFPLHLSSYLLVKIQKRGGNLLKEWSFDIYCFQEENFSLKIFFPLNKIKTMPHKLSVLFFIFIMRITRKTSWFRGVLLGGSTTVSFLFFFSSIKACLGVFSVFQVEFLLHGVHMLPLWKFHSFSWTSTWHDQEKQFKVSLGV